METIVQQIMTNVDINRHVIIQENLIINMEVQKEGIDMMKFLNFLFISKSFGAFLVSIGSLIGINNSIKMGLDKDINVCRLLNIGLAGFCVVLGSYLMFYEH